MYKVKVLELDRQGEQTDYTLATYEIDTDQKLDAIDQAGMKWKRNKLYQAYRHSYFLQVEA